MDQTTQKLIHSFGALADLGQEVADTGDLIEMVRTSLHLLLGTLAIRRGAVVECPRHLLPDDKSTNLLAVWGLGENYQPRFIVEDSDREAFLNFADGALQINSDEADLYRTGSGSDRVVDVGSGGEKVSSTFLARHQAELSEQQLELIISMIVRGNLTELVLLG